MDPNDTTIVFIGAFALVLGIIIVINIARYRINKLRSEERMAAIAKGILLPPESGTELASFGPEEPFRPPQGIRTGGLVLVFLGIGVVLFSFCLTWIVQNRHVLAVAAAGIIPLAIGTGLLVDYALRSRNPKPEGDESNSRAGVA